MKAIRLHRHGAPDALVYEDVDIGQPGPGEVRSAQPGDRRQLCRYLPAYR